MQIRVSYDGEQLTWAWHWGMRRCDRSVRSCQRRARDELLHHLGDRSRAVEPCLPTLTAP